MERKVVFDSLYPKKATIYIDPIAATPHLPGSHNMKLLHLDSSILAENSASRELSAAIVARWQRDVAGIEVIHRDLAGSHALPHLDGASLAKAGLQDSDIDWLIPHQANIRIMQSTARKLKMPAEKVVVTVDQHGNTSAASIPLALDAAVRDGRIQRGQTLMLEGVGGGFTWGSVLLRY